MATIAFIGSDGAGKTTVIKMIKDEFPRKVKYIYMGLNLESSNYSLPTSRLILYLKLHLIKRNAIKNGNKDPLYLSTHHISHRRKKRGRLMRTLRVVNRIVEAWYRQLISWYFQARGYLVVYDRHFLFDSAPNPGEEGLQPLSTQFFRWTLKTFYPKPDLVVFLDAEPEILVKRKQEVPLEYIVAQRAAIIDEGRRTDNFVTVDASQSIEKVYSDISQHIRYSLQNNHKMNNIDYTTLESD